ncbi:hypothetical protein R75471_07313 [Paraburkholderia domus]|uniref:hypothetical protein n=1 Tax=Paraburkholderia domus TaxID=2793075 RepID=UPI001B0DCEF7|nr:hypothetical protein [Paraburkholderia domus]CAE6968920.1 hypothetical protein R75471_07313 [Paraburkholderia domus]
MTQTTGAGTRSNQSLLPKDWARAPFVWCVREPHAFLIFVVVNFLFGTLGLWLPLVNAALGGHSTFHSELKKLLEAGGFYMYAVPFLAATVGVVFSSLKQETAAHALGTKILFSFSAMSIFVLCVVFLQIQVLVPAPSVEHLNYILQVIASVVTVIVALYMHAITQNEIGGSPQADMEHNAANLQVRAQSATVSRKDFE